MTKRIISFFISFLLVMSFAASVFSEGESAGENTGDLPVQGEETPAPDPSEPTGPVDPEEPDEPVDPTPPVEPEEPDEPVDPTPPVEPEEPDEPVEDEGTGPLDFSNATENLSGKNWQWNAALRSLTIQSAVISAEAKATIALPANSRIYFSGDCRIFAFSGDAIVADGTLIISGSGSLNVRAENYGIRCPDTVLIGEDISVTGAKAAASGLLEADGGYGLSVYEDGKYVSGIYNSQSGVRTGVRYPVYVAPGRGGVTSFYIGLFTPGETVTVSAYAFYGYALKNWESINVKLIDPESDVIAFVMPERVVGLTAKFERVYSVTVAESEGGHVEWVTEGSFYAPGDQVVLYAVPDTGYYFSHWASNVGRFRDPLQAYAALTMPHVNVTVKPVFVKGESYYLQVEKVGEGETNITIGNFRQNKSVFLRATPAEGYVFSGWMSAAGYFLSSDKSETYFIMPGQNVTVTAVFSLKEEQKKTLTVKELVGGKVNVTGGTYAPGMPIILLAEAKTGYRFAGWSIEPAEYADAFVEAKKAQTLFLMPTEDVTIYARFELLDAGAITFYLGIGATQGGTVSGDSPGDYLAGYEIDLSATPDEGYYFVGWKSAVGGSFDNPADPNTIFYMPANDTRVTAVFASTAEENLPSDSQGESGTSDPIDGADLEVGIAKEYLSFGLSLALCGSLTAGGTWYAGVSRRACGIKSGRNKKHKRKISKMKPRRKL